MRTGKGGQGQHSYLYKLTILLEMFYWKQYLAIFILGLHCTAESHRGIKFNLYFQESDFIL
jgi:hypothetical protein